MRILLFLEICLIAMGVWSLVMMLYRLFLMPAKEDFAPLVLPVGAEADSVEGRLRWAYWQTRSGEKYGFLYILDCGMSDETAPNLPPVRPGIRQYRDRQPCAAGTASDRRRGFTTVNKVVY